MVRTTWLGMLPPNQRTSPKAPATASQAMAPSTMLRRRTASPISQAAQATMATPQRCVRLKPAMKGWSRGMPKEVMIWKVENETAIQNRSRPVRPSPKLSGSPCSGFTDSAGASI